MNFVIEQKEHCRSILVGSNPPTLLRNGCLMLFGSLLIALSSKFVVPLQPIPITLQSLAVIFVGMSMGWRLGGSAVLLYLLEGFIGLPVFAAGSNVTHLGYLIGYFFAAILGGYLADCGWGKYVMTTFVAAGLASLVIIVSGYLVLAHFIGYNMALILGVKPFMLGDCLKVILLSCVIPAFWKKSAN